jgi:hypothetical protein
VDQQHPSEHSGLKSRPAVTSAVTRLLCLSILSLALAVGWTPAVSAESSLSSASGVVVYETGGCDYFVVSTISDYAVLEWYGGALPARGDVIVGNFESFGFKDVFNATQDRSMRVWVEDYWLSSSLRARSS